MANPKRPRDTNQLAKYIVDLATGGISEEMPEISVKQKAGRLGGLKGGKARAEKLSKAERSKIAKKAAQARWNK
ncbi:MAG: histone H1 [Pyrinomonadaceae bacterium]